MHICIILMDVHTERCLSICWNNLTCVVKDVEDREIRNINKLELTLDNKTRPYYYRANKKKRPFFFARIKKSAFGGWAT